MTSATPIGRDWSQQLAALIRSARDGLLISSPFITSAGCDLVRTNLAVNKREVGSVTVLTDFSPLAICQGANDPAALRSLIGNGYRLSICHLPRLHAKAYVADTHTAIVTSGNLTSGGLVHNFEYGGLHVLADTRSAFSSLSLTNQDLVIDPYWRLLRYW